MNGKTAAADILPARITLTGINKNRHISLIQKLFNGENMTPSQKNNEKNNQTRRDALKQLVLGGVGAAATVPVIRSLEETCLAEQKNSAAVKVDVKPAADPKAAEAAKTTAQAAKTDAVSGATRTSFNMPARAKLNEKMQLSKIGNVTISRMFLGGNLIGGWAHARDLIYVSDLVKAYHTKNKVFETFYIAEQCGINAFLGHYSLFDMVTDYWKWTDGKIQYIADCAAGPQNIAALPDIIKRTVDKGAVGCYLQGETTDRLVRENQFDLLEKCFNAIRDNKVIAGIGAHRIETLKAVVDHGIVPDFWMKTFHNHNYWSVKNPSEHDNVFCRKPDETAEFMKNRKEPWIAFKVLAAGAIRPKEGFRFAFEGGADFLCVGMYDFQVVDDVNICVDVLKSKINRQRPWITQNVDRKAYEDALQKAQEEAEEKEDA